VREHGSVLSLLELYTCTLDIYIYRAAVSGLIIQNRLKSFNGSGEA